MPELTDFNVKEALQALHAGQVSSQELTRSFLDRIDKLEPDIHAFITLTPERALQAAGEADKKRAELLKNCLLYTSDAADE